MPSDNIWSMVDGGDGKLYIGHVQHGFSVLRLNDRKVKNFMQDPNNPNSLPGNEVQCVYKDVNGNIWLGTDKGLALFNPEAENFIRFQNDEESSHHKVFDIRQFDKNKLWVAVEFGGIAILDLTQRMFQSAGQVQFQYIKEGDDEHSLSNPTVRCLFQDSYKNIWAGVWGAGINFLSHESSCFNVLSYSPSHLAEGSLNDKTASCVCLDDNGNLWIGTDRGGINVFNHGRRTAVYKNGVNGMNGFSVQTALCDSEGNLWFGMFFGGVNFYDIKKKTFSQVFPKDMANEDVRALYEDGPFMWVGTTNGIYKILTKEKSIVEHYTFGNNLVRCISKDSQNRLWIGTFGDGLRVYDSDFQLVNQFKVSQFPSNTINDIYIDKHNRVWVATGEGLVCFPSTSSWNYKVYQREEGLANTYIRAIAEDTHGNIWVSTNKGISCLLKDKDTFYNYDQYDNVPMGNFMSGSVAEDGKGNIFFGSVNGLCYFNPDIVLEKRNPPTAIITEMRIFEPLRNTGSNEEILMIDGRPKVRLNHLQNNFSVTFNIQNYALVNQVEYAYMLKGLDNSWYTVVTPNHVTFRNVPPGNYRFLVKTRIRNQEWSEKLASLNIRIEPPIWLTWWAKSCYVLAVFSLLCFIFYSYKKKLDMESLYKLEKTNREQEQELNNERLRFYTNITHEFRTPLTLILGPLEDLQKNNSLSLKDSQKISVIHQSAIRLLNLINQILEFRKTETQNRRLCVERNNIAVLVYEIGLKYKELNRKPGLEFQLNIEEENMPLYFDKEVVTIILDNLISNAIKYTEKGIITLSLYNIVRSNIRYTEISVSDTGFGIAADALPHVFERYYQEGSEHQASGTGIGLALVKNLVILHEGEIRAESTLNVGSTFYFSLLTDNIYPHVLHADPLEKNADKKEENVEPEHSGKRILLIVEDNQDISDYIADSFSDEFEVKTAENGKMGLEQALNCIPDIIVSDIMMPVMSGDEMCKRLKENVCTSHIPIILLTAKDSLQDKEKGYQMGADSYLTKPFSATLLHSRINNLMESRKKLADKFRTNSIVSDKRAAMTESMNKLDNEFIEKINKLIEECPSLEKVDIGYLADNMCMSNSTLYRKMKALTGLSTNEYIRKIKMQCAERLLLEGKYNVSEIAFKVGINSTVYFRQCFKEEFGLTPSDYIKKIKQK